jgi:heterodisulfide reductase subunit A
MDKPTTIKFTIDGLEIEAERGRMLLDVATKNSINIPTLCHHPSLDPYSACRLCLVEVKKRGRTKYTASCSYPVDEGIEVITNSEDIIKLRKMTIESLLAWAPNSDDLRSLAAEIGIEKTRFKLHEDLENKCILCGLCVNICRDVMGVDALGFANRGVNRKVATPFDEFSPVCTTCGACEKVCPTDAIHVKDVSSLEPRPILSEYDSELRARNANYVPFPQAVPNKPVIDKEHCMQYLTGKCGACKDFCEVGAIEYGQEDKIEEVDVGAVVVSTGFDLYNKKEVGEYGYGSIPDVIDGLQFERILSATGPTGGQVRRPSDGKVPKEIVFVQCVGSRDPELGVPYCSKVCCMYTAKQALLYKHAVHDGQAYVFYIDIRSAGKGYEEFVQRAQEEEGILYLRGKVSKIFQEPGKKGEDGKVIVWGADTLSGKKIEIAADLVVLATAIVPSEGIKELASKLRISTDEFGFVKEAHLKLRPAETLTAGVYLAGVAQSPKDITDSVAQGSATASKILGLFSQDELLQDPMISVVDQDICAGCGSCVTICAYGAAELDEKKNVAHVNEALCEGCGACAAVCPSGAMEHKNFSKKQVLDMIDVATEEYG